MKKLSLLLILPDDPLQPVGGVGEKYKHLLSGIINTAYERITCYVVSTAQGKKDQVSGGVSYHYIFKSGVFVDYDLLDGVLQNEQDTRYDLVMSADWFTAYYGYLASRFLHCRWIHCFELGLYSYQRLYDQGCLSPENQILSNYILRLEKLAMDRSDRLVVLCKKYYDDLLEEYKNKSVIIPNGYPFDKWIRTGMYPLPKQNQYNFLYIGRLSSQKGVQFLLDSLELPENVNLYFAGGKDASDLYQRVVDHCGRVTNKIYLGFISDFQDKVNLISSMTGVVMPSIHEPFGIVGTEVMISGTPLITTAVDGIGDYANEQNSFLCTPTSESIKASMLRVMGVSAAEREKVVNQAREDVKKYDLRNVVDEYRRVFDEVLA